MLAVVAPVHAQPLPGGALAAAVVRVEAVRAQALDAQGGIVVERDRPPVTGWVEVALPDAWAKRWPDFDGVVWYRLHWRQADSGAPTALMLDYLNMAGAVYLNGTLLVRDAQLADPLSRTWNLPRYQVLPAALLRQGDNVLEIRVSGMARYQAGLGPVAIGAPERVRAHFDWEHWLRVQSQWFSLAVTVTLGCFFLSMWLMRRRETVYGWFSLMSLAWWACVYNQVADSPWPFASTDGWAVANTVSLLVFNGTFTMFILRFCERRWPRYESVLWSLVAIACGVLWLAPPAHLESLRAFVTGLQSVHYFVVSLVFIAFAWRKGRTDHRILAFFLALAVAAGVNDTMNFLGVFNDNLYLTPLSVLAEMICMALILGWQFVANLRRIERFNDELTQSVEAARRELTQTLQRQYELEIAYARLGERLHLAHDLHDGLGGILVSSIATLERAPQDMPPPRFLAVLKELRDDLRIIIDSATSQQYGEMMLVEQIAPLRHRMTRLLEAHGIDCHWRLSDRCVLPPAASLDLMRVLQEALTNVLRHSHASWAEVELQRDAVGLWLTIRDNGIGFPASADGARHGTGLHSMRARAGRLGGTLDVTSSPGATAVTLMIPVVTAPLSA